MANITQAPGGGVVANGVVSYLPQCSADGYSDLSADQAAAFDPTSSDYYVALIPTVVPGLVLGLLGLLGFIFFSLWSCAQCCGRRRGGKSGRPAAERAQFLAGFQEKSAPGVAAAAQPAGWRRWARPGTLFKTLLVATALAVVALAGWGLALSIQATNSTFSDLWELVQDVNLRVSNATAGLATLDSQLRQLNGNVSALTNSSAELVTFSATLIRALDASDSWNSGIQQLSERYNVSGVSADQAVALLNTTVERLTTLPEELAKLESAIGSGRRLLEENVGKVLRDMRQDWEAPTMAIEETWRFIPIAVVFGTTLPIGLLCALLFWRLGHYRWATLVAALLWLDVALLMLLGVGLFNGVHTVSGDACRYVEDFALRQVQRISSESQRAKMTNALSYYFGVLDIPDSMVVNDLLGVPTYLLHDYVFASQSIGQQAAANPLVQMGLGLGAANPEVVTQIQAAADTLGLPYQQLFNSFALIPNLSDTVWGLETQALRSSINPLYHSSKTYICCTLAENMSDLFVAWTVTGALGLALAAMCSWRLARHALDLRKLKRRAMAEAAAAAGGGSEEGAFEVAAYSKHGDGATAGKEDAEGSGSPSEGSPPAPPAGWAAQYLPPTPPPLSTPPREAAGAAGPPAGGNGGAFAVRPLPRPGEGEEEAPRPAARM